MLVLGDVWLSVSSVNQQERHSIFPSFLVDKHQMQNVEFLNVMVHEKLVDVIVHGTIHNSICSYTINIVPTV